MDNKELFSEMNYVLNSMKEIYGEKYIFGIFYTKDKNILLIIIPTLDDIIHNRPGVDQLDIKDIRKVNFDTIVKDIWIINPRYEYLFHSLPDAQLLKEKIIRGLVENNKVIHLLKQMNDTDKLVMETILSEIGLEGIISQYKIAVKANVSRLAVSNLIAKLNNSGLVEVKYLGNQGTYIKILETILLDIRGRYAKE